MEPQPQPPLLEVKQGVSVTVARFTCTHLYPEATVEAARRQLEALLDGDGPPRLVLSFAVVDFLNGNMLSRLIGLHRKVKTAGGRLALCALKPDILRVFQIVQL